MCANTVRDAGAFALIPENRHATAAIDQPKPTRAALRRSARAHRRALTPEEHARLSAALCRKLVTTLVFLRARRYASYLSNENEPDLSGIHARAAAMGKQAYLPCLHGPRLWFLPLGSDTPLALNRFGIPEPDTGPGSRIAPMGLDLVLMPLVAFDRFGGRLGMGGGYYDRTFAYLRRRSRWHRPKLVGVAFEFQQVDQVPVRGWDIPLDGVITERGLRARD